jgi:hypothetical protein
MFSLVLAIFIRFPAGPRPMCHRQIDGAFLQWAIETHHTNEYPNINGDGHASLGPVERFMGRGIHQYAYVPGLHYNDPTNLVLMYMKEKTRHSWHGDSEHSIFWEPRWMVLSPDLISSGTAGEGGDLLDTPEFKRRIELTLAFLKENQRPNWKVVTEEQLAFLRSIRD